MYPYDAIPQPFRDNLGGPVQKKCPGPLEKLAETEIEVPPMTQPLLQIAEQSCASAQANVPQKQPSILPLLALFLLENRL